MALVLVALSGCRLQVIALSGGEVQSISSGTCLEQTVCVHEITDSSYTETFTAVPAPGYLFGGWSDGAGFLCKGSTSPVCVVNSTTLSGVSDALIRDFPAIYLMPIFTTNLPMTNTVLLADREWAQLTAFEGRPMSWNDVNDVCPVAAGGVCGGGLNGFLMTGWTWASSSDFYALVNFYGATPPMSADNYFISEFDSVWGPQIWPAMEETSTSEQPGTGEIHNEILGLLGEEDPDDNLNAVLGLIRVNDPNGATELTLLDQAGTANICCKDIVTPISAWFYRTP
jgi:hypothetical protein